MGEGSVELEAIIKEAVDLVCEIDNKKYLCGMIVFLCSSYLFLLNLEMETCFSFLNAE